MLILGVEWWNTHQHLISAIRPANSHEDAERPPVGFFAVAFLSDDFWGNILWSSYDSVGFSTGVAELLGHTEIGQLKVTVRVQEDILRLQVSVDDVFLVEILKCQQDLSCIELGAA